MVQARENWADLRGQVEQVEDEAGGWVSVRVRVDGTDEVPGYPNLLEPHVGQSVTVKVPAADCSVAAGDRIRARVRNAGPNRYFTEPGSLTIE